MTRLLVILALFLCSGAEAQVRVFHTFTPAAKSYINNTLGKSTNDWIGQQIGSANARAQESGSTVTFVNAGKQEGWCCGANVAGTGHISEDPVTKESSLQWAAKDPKTAKGRDDADADVTVVVGAYSGDKPYESYMDCTKTGEAAALRGVVGVNANQQGTDTWGYLSAVAKALCAGELGDPGNAQGYYWTTGWNTTNCKNWSTLNAPLQTSRNVTVNFWRVIDPGLANVIGEGGSAGDANTAMAARCPYATGTPGYTCTALTCNVQGGGANCNHTRSLNGAPPTTVYNIANGSKIQTNFTCTNFQRLNVFSNVNPILAPPPYPSVLLQIGDATHNNVGAMQARKAATEALRNHKIWKKIAEAAGLYTGKKD
jgi:hypothetical protein